MNTLNKKNLFLSALMFRLSFIIPYPDVINIIDDYDDWIDNESSNYKKQAEIYQNLHIGKIISENKNMSHQNFFQYLLLLMNNPYLVLLFSSLVIYFAELILLDICKINGYNYVGISAITNFLFFIMVILNIKKEIQLSVNHNYTKRIPFIPFGVVLLLFICFPTITYLFNSNYSGICTEYFLILFSIIFLCIQISYIYTNSRNIKHISVQLIFVKGLISLIFYYISQLHAIYSESSDYYAFAICSFALILEMTIFCIYVYRKDF